METKAAVHGQLLDDEEDIKPMSINEVGGGEIKVNYLSGIINQEDGLRFKRLLFRISKGFAWSMIVDIDNEIYGLDQKVIILNNFCFYFNYHY